MDVSIIFVNYNTITLLCNAIDSVLEYTCDVSYEIIVVDNASSDNSEKILFDKYNKRVLYVNLPENIGFGRANNEGIRFAKGNSFFFLNPDTVLMTNAINILFSYLNSDEKIGVTGGNLYNVDGSPQASYSHSFPSLSSQLLNLFGLSFLANQESFNYTMSPKIVHTVYGAAFMVKRKVIDEVGGFDSRFFMYGEEDELCNRINKKGYYIVNVPHCRIMHLDGGSFEYSEQRVIRQLVGLNVLYRISYSPLYCRLIQVVEYLTIVSRLILFAALGKKDKLKPWIFKFNFFKFKDC